MSVDEAMEAVRQWLQFRPSDRQFKENIAIVLFDEVERLRAELAVASEAVKSLANSFDKLRDELWETKVENTHWEESHDSIEAELAAAKAASVCPVQVVYCEPDYERTATVVLWSNADAQRFADWLNDRIKERGE